MKRESRFTRLHWGLVIIGDFIILNSLFLLIHYFVFSVFKDNIPFSLRETVFLLNISYLPITFYQRRYHRQYVLPPDRIITMAFASVILHWTIFLSLFYFLRVGEISRYFLIIYYVLFLISLILFWFLERFFVKKWRRAGRNYRKVVIVGAGKNGLALMKEMVSDPSYGFRFMGFFEDADQPEEEFKTHNLGKVEDLECFLKNNKVDEIYCALPGQAGELITHIISLADKYMVRYYFIPGHYRYLKRRVTLDYLGSTPLMAIREEPLQNNYNAFIKRVFDLCFSTLVIVLLFPPLLLIVWIGNCVTGSHGSLFFKQERTGERGRSFLCYKFRSMRVNDSCDEVQATKNDERITPFGSFLRRSSIDEIPQFINVFIGDMSVVGPRPHMLKHTEIYSALIDKYMIRHLVKPGITGLAQVSGFRGETRELWQMEKRVEYDVRYIERWSLAMDVRIILRTVLNMFVRDRNAY